MSELVIRKIPFELDGVDFFWNPDDKPFSLLANVLSFQTIGFERFICKSMSEAQPAITDPAILKEAKDFSKQEMVHSQAHLKHVRAMVGQYPALQDVFDESMADFDTHWQQHDLEYRLAYSAIIEATSLPLYKVVLKHRGRVLAGGDRRVASLLLWHFCEEVEHRGSAMLVYRHVVGRPWYRLRVFPEVGRHLASNMMRIADSFAKIVPGVADVDIRRATASFPRLARLKMMISLMTSQLPWYDPAADELPHFCREWMRRYEAGDDMRLVQIV